MIRVPVFEKVPSFAMVLELMTVPELVNMAPDALMMAPELASTPLLLSMVMGIPPMLRFPQEC